MRVQSAQKLPRPSVCRRAKPRNKAKASAMPVAADMKLWITSPSIWLRLESVLSPAYHCQLVLVVKLIAVLNAPSGARLANLGALSGR